MMSSKSSLFVCIAVLLAVHFLYYPKWKMDRTEATLSWDVSGYYMYLPATFIYHDLEHCGFKDEVLSKYYPTPDFQQAFVHEASGNYVMKYAMGQAIVMSPFFAVAHMWASVDDRYLADGFSFPYQFMISMGALLIAILGLYFLRKVLLYYFEDRAVALAMFALVLGTNYLNYSAIDGAMTHNTLFTIYAILLFLTIRFYERATYLRAVGIGLCVGLAALIRPTEIIAALLPVLWGLAFWKKEALLERWQFLRQHLPMLIASVAVAAAIGFLQPLYWHHVSGEWIVYSYQDQGFSWLRPHLREGFFSYKSGWLLYSPMICFALIGFGALRRQREGIFPTVLLFMLVFVYITFAWDIWWYGGALGQRAMVQSYAVLALPLAAFAQWLDGRKGWLRWLLFALGGFFVYVNLWFTHQAHRGQLLHADQMNKAYYWKTFLTYDKNPEHLKLLDEIDELYEGRLNNQREVLGPEVVPFGLDQNRQYSETMTYPATAFPLDYDWVRVSADVGIQSKEWNYWTMTKLRAEFKNHGELVEKHMIRLQRHLHDGQRKVLFMDLPRPNALFTDLEVKVDNANGQKPITIHGIQVTVFEE